MTDTFTAQIGAFMEPTQSLDFATLAEAAGWFFRQSAAYAAISDVGRNGRILLRRHGQEPIVLAEYDFMKVRS